MIVRNITLLATLFVLLGGFQGKKDTSTRDLDLHEQDEKIFIDFIEKLGQDSVLKYNYIVINSESSSASIGELISLIRENNSFPLTYQSYKYIPTKIVLSAGSLKHLRQKFGADLLSFDNVLLDTTNAWINSGIAREHYAEIFYTYNKKLVKRVALDTSVLEKSLIDLKAWEYSTYAQKLYSMDSSDILLLNTKALPLEAQTVAGEVVKLFSKETSSKIIVLNFWVDGCAYCKVSMPIMNRIYGEYKNRNVEVMSIYGGNEETLKKYFDDPKFNKSSNQFINFPIIANAMNIIKDYEVTFYPSTYVIDPNGNISFISGFTKGTDESISNANGVEGENPYYYLILKGQLDKLLLELDK